MLFARMSGAFEGHAGHPDVSNAFAGEVSGMAVSEFAGKHRLCDGTVSEALDARAWSDGRESSTRKPRSLKSLNQ